MEARRPTTKAGPVSVPSRCLETVHKTRRSRFVQTGSSLYILSCLFLSQCGILGWVLTIRPHMTTVLSVRRLFHVQAPLRSVSRPLSRDFRSSFRLLLVGIRHGVAAASLSPPLCLNAFIAVVPTGCRPARFYTCRTPDIRCLTLSLSPIFAAGFVFTGKGTVDERGSKSAAATCNEI